MHESHIGSQSFSISASLVGALVKIDLTEQQEELSD